jgi:hypothetical protein
MSGAFLIGRGPDGKDQPVLLNADGAIKVDIGESIEVTVESVTVEDTVIEVSNDETNPVPVAQLGEIDTGNGYSGILTAGQNFTGTGIEVAPKYGTISVCIFSSHASASMGLRFQASIDNTNWETIEEYNYLAGSGLESYSFSPSGRYFRLSYTNGGTETTKTAIFTVLRSGYIKSSSHRIGDVISAEKDAELVKAVLAAMKPNGEFMDIHCTAGGNLKVSIEEAEEALETAVAARTPTTTSVASSITSVTILAANANRKGLTICNDSTSVLRLSFATPATTANAFLVMQPNTFVNFDQQLITGGAIYGIWASANGTAQVTQYL